MKRTILSLLRVLGLYSCAPFIALAAVFLVACVADFATGQQQFVPELLVALAIALACAAPGLVLVGGSSLALRREERRERERPGFEPIMKHP